MENFSEFRKSILKVTGPRHHKITGSLGVKDAYKWLQRNKWPGLKGPISEKDFYAIIRTVNKLYAESLVQGEEVLLPHRMGKLELRKYNTYIRLENGKIKTNRGVDWDATLKLWNEDEEAKENKTLVKVEQKEVFTLFYNRLNANYNNKAFYQIRPNRELMKRIHAAAKEGLIDAFKLTK